jgi:hypothetical protein
MNLGSELSSIVLIYEGSCLGGEHILSDKTILWASLSDRPLIRGLTEKLNLFVSMKILYIRVCELSKFLVGNLIVLNKLKVTKNLPRRSTLEVI